MALGKRMREERSGWVATTDLPVSPGHRFYQKLNRLLDEAKPRRSGSARRRAVNHLQYPAVRPVQRPANSDRAIQVGRDGGSSTMASYAARQPIRV